jgi:hypothetical protein
MPSIRLILPLLLCALLLAGCATPVTVTSNPAGASVYCRGSGRPAYRWKYRGNTPVTFKVPYNAIQTFVQWPDREGRRSEVRRSELLFEEAVKLHFERPAAAGGR